MPRAPGAADPATPARSTPYLVYAFRQTGIPLPLILLVLAAWLVTAIWASVTGNFRAYGDAMSHELLARAVTDSLSPGLGNIGTVWLPLPSSALAPLVAIDPLWQSGWAGAIVGLVYLLISVGSLYVIGSLLAGKPGGWLAAIVFLGNPNTLYLYVTPMTEPAAFAMAALCAAATAVVLDGYGKGEVRNGAVIVASFGAAGAMLSRYDAWFLAVFAGAVMLGGVYWRFHSIQKAQAVAITYAFGPFVAMMVWIVFNWTIFGDPLEFLRGEYASANLVEQLARDGIIPNIDGKPPEEGRPDRAFMTFGMAVIENLGLATTVVLVLGTIVSLVMAVRRPANWVMVVLLAPFVFYLVALTTSQSVIVTRAVLPEGLFNVRYGDTMALAAAAAAAGLIGPFRGWVRIGAAAVIGLIVVANGVWLALEPGGPVVYKEGRLQIEAPGPQKAADVAAWLRENRDSGLILIDDVVQPQAKVILTESGLPLQQFVKAADRTLWRRSLDSVAARGTPQEARAQIPVQIQRIVTMGPQSRAASVDRLQELITPEGTIPGFERVYGDDQVIVWQRVPGERGSR